MSEDVGADKSPTADSASPVKKSKWRWLKRALWTLLFIVLLLAGAVSWIVGTETGTRWSLNTAQNKLNELTIEQPQGSWWRGIHFDRLHWQQPNLSADVKSLSTAWRFECLLDRVFCIDNISVDVIEVQLAPSEAAQEPAPSSEPLTLPEIALPVGIDLAALNLGSVQIDLGDGGEAHVVNGIQLSVTAQQNRVELRTLKLAYQQYSAALQGGIQLEGEYPLGFVLTAAAQPLLDEHDQNLNVRFGGSLQNLTINGDTGGLADAAFSAELQPLDKQLPYAAKITWDEITWPPNTTEIVTRNGEVTAAGDLQNYAVTLSNSLEGEGIPAAKIQLSGEGDLARFRLAELLVDTLGGRVAASGDVDWSDGVRWAADLNFDNIDPSVQWPDVAGNLQGKLLANGLLEGEALTASLDELAVDGRLLEYPLSLRMSAEHASDQTITLKTLSLLVNDNDAGVPKTQLTVSGAGDYSHFDAQKILIETLGGSVDASSNVDWRDGVRWAAQVDFADIDPSVQWPDVAGNLRGQLFVNGLLDGEAITANLDQLAVDGRVLEYPLSLRVSAEHKPDKTITLKQLTLSVDENQAGVPKTDLAIAGVGDYTHFDFGDIRIDTLGGDVDGNAKVDWSDGIDWSAALAINAINPGEQWEDFAGQLGGEIQAVGTAEGESWTLDVKHADISGQLREYPLALSAMLNRSADGQFTIEKVALNSGDNRVQIAGSLSDSWALDGDLSIEQPETLLPDIGGKVDAQFAVRGAREKPDVELTANAKSLAVPGVSIDALTIEASVVALGESDSRLAAGVNGIKTDALAIKSVDLDFSGSRTAHQLALSTDGDINTSIELRGALDDALNWLGTLNAADIDAYQQAWSLSKPTDIAWKNETKTVDVAAHCWARDEARVCLEEDATIADSGNAKFSIRDFSLASLEEFFPERAAFEGVVAGDGDVRWQAGQQPQANVTLGVSDGLVKLIGEGDDDSLDLQYRSLSADIAASQNTVTAKLSLDSSDMGNANADVTIDPVSEDKTIDGDIALDQLELVTFKAFFPQLQTLDGTFSSNGKISGNLSAPRYVGDANIDGLNVAADGLPVSIEQGFFNAKIDGTRADIDAGWQSGGVPVTLIGDADWQDINAPIVNLALDGKEIEVRQAPTVIAKVSPSIKLAVNGQDIDVSGRVEIPYARITVQELPPNATQISKDVIIVVDEEAPVEEEKGPRITTNVIIVLGKDVRLEGFGLRASLTGDIGIEQKPGGVPLLDGEVQIPDGIYKAYGQNLKIQRGRLLFVGPVDETAIDIDAARTVGSVTAGLKVRGSIKNPEVTLFSSPQQTQENTLSYIVLGKPIGAKSGGSEAGILAQAALALGIKGGRGIATSIAEQFGIQDFQIDTVGDGDDSQVQLSGRLSPNLLLSYGVGVLTPVNTLTLRYNLTERFYVETAQSVESALDFFYTFDF